MIAIEHVTSFILYTSSAWCRMHCSVSIILLSVPWRIYLWYVIHYLIISSQESLVSVLKFHLFTAYKIFVYMFLQFCIDFVPGTQVRNALLHMVDLFRCL